MLLAGGWGGGRDTLNDSGGRGALDCCDWLGLPAGEEASGDVAGGVCKGV
jgi:hypothetical protein